MSESHNEWNELVKIMTELINNEKLTEAFIQLRILSSESADENCSSRKTIVPSYFTYGYNFEQRQYYHNQQVQLPKNILEPWTTVAQRLDYQDSALATHNAAVNKRRYVGQAPLSYEEVLQHPETIAREHIEPLVTALVDQVERVFHLIMIFIGIKAISNIRIRTDIEQTLENDHVGTPIHCLINIIESIHSIKQALKHTNRNPASETDVDPISSCSTIGVAAQRMLLNEPDISDTSSPLFYLLDHFSNGIEHESHFGKDHLKFDDITQQIFWKLRSMNDDELQTLANDIESTISRRIPYILRGSSIKLRPADGAMSALYTTVTYSPEESDYEPSTILSILTKYVKDEIAAFAMTFNRTMENTTTLLFRPIIKDIITHSHPKDEESLNSDHNTIRFTTTTRLCSDDAARNVVHSHRMLVDGAKLSTVNVSFTIAELVMHNNKKLGYWIAISGLVYNISHIIDQHPGDEKKLIENSGTDLTRDLQTIHARLSAYCIGRLADYFHDEVFNEIKQMLYTCTRIENSIHLTVDDQSADSYRTGIYNTQSAMMRLFHDLPLYSTEVVNQFQLLNETVTGLLHQNISFEELLYTLYQYKGLCYLTKYTLDKALTSKNLDRQLEENSSLLIRTIEKTRIELKITNPNTVRKHQITIIGGSLCGLVLAIYLRKIFVNIHVYDKLDDPRIKYKEHSSASFNITLSSRGFSALSGIGLQDVVREICIPLYGRCYHVGENDMVEQLYGPQNEALYAVKRDDLLSLLISEADKGGIHLHYGVECKRITYSDGPTTIHATEILSKRSIEIHTDFLFGADGFNSKVRETIDRQLPIDQRSKIVKHEMIYREFFLPATHLGEYVFRHDRLHIWPRDEFILLAFPNTGGSFTLTLCVPSDHEIVDKLQTDPHYTCSFMKAHFPDISSYVERLILTEPQQRWGCFNQVNAHIWHVSDKVLILGDAAHAFYPFFGQAANSAFEDCRYLTRLIQTFPDDWSTILTQFQGRKEDTDTIANLSGTHRQRLSNTINREELLFQTKISLEITRQDPRIQPLYSLVAFTDIPYKLAPPMAKTHDGILIAVSQRLEYNHAGLNDQLITSTVADVILSNRRRAEETCSYGTELVRTESREEE